ncbi:MAG: sulfate permease [Flavobacteriales bacterium]|nr:sulfate permease [Flavobacteriales bacterium]
MLTSILKDPKVYVRQDLLSDLMAGLTVAIMLIPQGMAYALLAGLPPIYGLYAGLVPMIIYPLFGTSRFLSVGPVALVSIIVLTGLSQMAEPMTPEFIRLAILLSLISGVIQVLLSVFKMGFLVNFLSQPVISGFTSAAALIIAVSQLKYLLGIPLRGTVGFQDTLLGLISNVDSIQVASTFIGLSGLILILVLKKIHRSIPGALIAVVLGIVLVGYMGIGGGSVDTVGEVPAGLPRLMNPITDLHTIWQLIPLALVICLISFIESLAISKTLAAKHEEYSIDANKELLGLGMAKVLGAFFQAFPNTGSFTRSAINEQSGARTGLASWIAVIIIGLVLLFFTGTLSYLPNTILAAIVISAVFGLIDIKGALHLYRTHKGDFIVLLITFVLTLFLGIQKGVLVGVILSLLFILHKVSRPHYAVLGKLEEHDVYRNIQRFDQAQEDRELLIMRYDADIFFGNAEHFYETIIQEVEAKKGIKDLLIDMNAVGHIDSTGIVQFELLVKSLETMGVRLHLCSVKGPVRDEFRNYKLGAFLHGNQIHWDIDNAIARIKKSKQ